jgi:Acetoacetate decarboxylase (ADC)
MTLSTDEVASLTGAGGAVLPETVVDVLPDSTPGAPWTVTMSSLLWMQRALPAARRALTPPLEARPGFAVTSCGFIRYDDSPVGPYSEVMASPCLARGGKRGHVHVPFIAVDSVPSVHAGRAHWALPKVLATFHRPDDRTVRAEGDGWSLSARVVRRGPPIPLRGSATVAQVRPDGRIGIAPLRIRGRGRLALVAVEASADAPFAPWLASGRHLGVEVSRATMTVGVPQWRHD